MAEEWTAERLQQLINDGVEESDSLEYKRAAALDRNGDKPLEITKDVSAFANAAGGMIIYGIAEGRDAQRHVPERFDPVNRQRFSKEWLEQVINTIEPRIGDALKIHPIALSTPDEVAYIVEIPKSNTAHQAADFRYYRRYNFQVLPMKDHEVRDVMNRRKHWPNLFPIVTFKTSHHPQQLLTDCHLHVLIGNRGPASAENVFAQLRIDGIQSYRAVCESHWHDAGNWLFKALEPIHPNYITHNGISAHGALIEGEAAQVSLTVRFFVHDAPATQSVVEFSRADITGALGEPLRREGKSSLLFPPD